MSNEPTFARLRRLARSASTFRHYPYEDGPPGGTVEHVAVLDGAEIVVRPTGGGDVGWRYQVQEQEGQAAIDLGGALNPGMLFCPGRPSRAWAEQAETDDSRFLWKWIHREEDGLHFSYVGLRSPEEGGEGGDGNGDGASDGGGDGADGDGLLLVDLQPLGRTSDGGGGGTPAGGELAPEWRQLISESGALVHNVTRPSPDGDGGDADDMIWYHIHFVDLCVQKGLRHIGRARERLLRVRRRAEAGQLEEMVRGLRSAAENHHRLQQLSELLGYLSYLRWIAASPAMRATLATYMKVPTGTGSTVGEQLDRLVDEVLPELEANLVVEGRPLSLDEFREKVDRQLARMRSASPLLGRMEWEEIRGADDAELHDAVQDLADRLLSSNAEAEQMMYLSRERIHTGLGANTLMIIPVLRIPPIVNAVRAELERTDYEGDPIFRLAVHRLLANRAMMPWASAIVEIALGFFCPPLGAALGLFAWWQADTEADLKEALADATLDPSKALVSQAEAESARFWATVEGVFAVGGGALDLLDTAGSIAKSVRRTAPGMADDAAGSVDDLAAAGKLEAGEADEAGRLARGEEPDDEVFDVAGELEEGTASARRARERGVDLEESRRLAADDDLEEAVEEGMARFRDEWLEAPEAEVEELLEQVKGDYLKYAERRRTRIENGADAPQPRKFEDVAAVEMRKLRGEDPAPLPKKQPRRTLLDIVAGDRRTGATAEEVFEMVGDVGELRRGIMAVADWDHYGRMSGGFGAADHELVDALRTARRRGASGAELDEIVRTRLVEPLREVGRTVGFQGEDALRFGAFSRRVPGTEAWDEDALSSLARLWSSPDVPVEDLRLVLRVQERAGDLDAASVNRLGELWRRGAEGAVDRIVRKPQYIPFASELADALEVLRAKGVKGVFEPVVEDGKAQKTLVEWLMEPGADRGRALEAMVAARIAEDAPEGVRVVVGKKVEVPFLKSMADEVGQGGIDHVDADVLVEFADDTPPVLIDTKWYDHARISRGRHTQIYRQVLKYGVAVEQGVLSRAEFWVSHRVWDRAGADFGAFEEVGRFVREGSVGIRPAVFEDPPEIPRLVRQWRRGGDAAPRAPDPAEALASDVGRAQERAAGLLEADHTAERVLLDVAPLGETRPREPVPVGRTVRTSLSDESSSLSVPTDLGTDLAVTVLPKVLSGGGAVTGYGLYRAAPGDEFHGTPARQIMRRGLRRGERRELRTALEDGELERVEPEGGATPVIQSDPQALYTVAWRSPPLEGVLLWRVRVYHRDGRPRAVFPEEFETMDEGWNLLSLAGPPGLSALPRGAVSKWILTVKGAKEEAHVLRLVRWERDDG